MLRTRRIERTLRTRRIGHMLRTRRIGRMLHTRRIGRMLRACGGEGGSARRRVAARRTAGNEEATPRPMPMAEDQSIALDGTTMATPERMQQIVFAKTAGHAEVTAPERKAQPIRPMLIAVQKLDDMIAMVSSPNPRCLMPNAGSHVAVECSSEVAKKHSALIVTITTTYGGSPSEPRSPRYTKLPSLSARVPLLFAGGAAAGDLCSALAAPASAAAAAAASRSTWDSSLWDSSLGSSKCTRSERRALPSPAALAVECGAVLSSTLARGAVEPRGGGGLGSSGNASATRIEMAESA